MGQPRPLLLFIFGLFKQTSSKKLQQIQVKNVHPGTRCQDSKPPLEHESPPITTRPELPFNWNFRYLFPPLHQVRFAVNESANRYFPMAQSEPRIDLCCWKQPLCLLYHNPNIKMFLKGGIPSSFSFIFGLLKKFCRQN